MTNGKGIRNMTTRRFAFWAQLGLLAVAAGLLCPSAKAQMYYAVGNVTTWQNGTATGIQYVVNSNMGQGTADFRCDIVDQFGRTYPELRGSSSPWLNATAQITFNFYGQSGVAYQVTCLWFIANRGNFAVAQANFQVP